MEKVEDEQEACVDCQFQNDGNKKNNYCSNFVRGYKTHIGYFWYCMKYNILHKLLAGVLSDDVLVLQIVILCLFLLIVLKF